MFIKSKICLTIIVILLILLIYVNIEKKGGDFTNIPKFILKFWYNLISKYNVSTMNYGYSENFDNVEKIYDKDFFSLNLYDFVAKDLNENVLEIGCGSGTGLFFLAKKYPNVDFTGIDFAKKSIENANNTNKLKNTNFQYGDAENLNFLDKSFKNIINVESAHNYKDMDKFLFHVYRVLKDDGTFYFTDLINIHNVNYNDYINYFKKYFTIKEEINISNQVLNALNNNKKTRELQIKNKNIGFFDKIIFNYFKEEFIASRKSKIYKNLIDGKVIYIYMKLEKHI